MQFLRFRFPISMARGSRCCPCFSGAVTIFLFIWHPKKIWGLNGRDANAGGDHGYTKKEIISAWTPWINLNAREFVWGLPQMEAFLDGIAVLEFPIAGLDKMVIRIPPVVADPTAEAAVYDLNRLYATGTGILPAGIISAFVMGSSLSGMAKIYGGHLMPFGALC